MAETETETETATEAERIRLHITPFTASLYPTIINSTLQPQATNLSFHTVQSDPDRGFGYIELPKPEAEKLRKKLNGMLLRGAKMKIEVAKPEKRKLSEAKEEQDDSGDKESPKKKAKKTRRKDLEIRGHELPSDRIVKRGWTEEPSKSTAVAPPRDWKAEKEAAALAAASGKKHKDRKQKQEKSKFTTGKEVLFKTQLPIKSAVIAAEDAAKAKKDKKEKKLKEASRSHAPVVIHEFEKNMQFPSFLRANKLVEGSKGVATEYVEGKGWVDAQGVVIEPVKSSGRREDRLAQLPPNNLEVVASDDDDVDETQDNDEEKVKRKAERKERKRMEKAEKKAKIEAEEQAALASRTVVDDDVPVQDQATKDRLARIDQLLDEESSDEERFDDVASDEKDEESKEQAEAVAEVDPASDAESDNDKAEIPEEQAEEEEMAIQEEEIEDEDMVDASDVESSDDEDDSQNVDEMDKEPADRESAKLETTIDVESEIYPPSATDAPSLMEESEGEASSEDEEGAEDEAEEDASSESESESESEDESEDESEEESSSNSDSDSASEVADNEATPKTDTAAAATKKLSSLPTEEEEDKPAAPKEVHPLEALFKRPSTATAQTGTNGTPSKPTPIKTSFSFFAGGNDDEEEDLGDAIPATPWNRRERSAAPTPDTAAIGKRFSFSQTANRKFDNDEEDEEGYNQNWGGNDHENDDGGYNFDDAPQSLPTPAPKKYQRKTDAKEEVSRVWLDDGEEVEEGDDEPNEKGETGFKKIFWETRGDANRAFKRRRREVSKVVRQRENRRIGRRVV